MAGGVKSFRELIVWQKAMDLVTEIYQATKSFPANEQYGLTNQLRRAAVSIPSNIAEGQGRNSPGEFIRFLTISRGSLQEVQTQIELAYRLHYIAQEQAAKLINSSEEVARLLNGLVRCFQSSEN